jgi:hypothetical protein
LCNFVTKEDVPFPANMTLLSQEKEKKGKKGKGREKKTFHHLNNKETKKKEKNMREKGGWTRRFFICFNMRRRINK